MSIQRSILVKVDKVSDYIPVVSTVTNIVDIVAKFIFSKCCDNSSISNDHYYSHIQDKSLLRCIVLLIPILGNVIIAIYDFFQHENQLTAINISQGKLESEIRTFHAEIIGVDPITLPASLSEIGTSMKEDWQRINQNIIDNLNGQINQLHQISHEFKQITNNPPLSEDASLSTHYEKSHQFWKVIKLMLPLQKLSCSDLDFWGLDRNELIVQKQNEIKALVKEFVSTWRNFYKNYLETLQKAELINEGKKYYIESFPPVQQEEIRISIQNIDPDKFMDLIEKKIGFVNILDRDSIAPDKIELSEISNRYSSLELYA